MTATPTHISHELKDIQNLLVQISGEAIQDLMIDPECADYLGFNFQLGKLVVKFRKAKITPKKIGQFVTLWKRDHTGKTVPYDHTDHFDFCIIKTNNAEQSGFFVFPKNVLVEMNILSSYERSGKRGFRLYAEWDHPESIQGIKTKLSQAEYFINLTPPTKDILKLQRIMKQFSTLTVIPLLGIY